VSAKVEEALRIKRNEKEKKRKEISKDVDDKYIQSYLTDSKKYFDQAQRDYDDLNWTTGTDKTKNEARKSAADDLQGRSSKIRAYLSVNKNYMDETAYNGLLEYLDSTDGMYYSSLQDFDDAYKFYSQWESEDLYMRDNAFYEKYGKLSQNEDYATVSANRDLGSVNALDYVDYTARYYGGSYGNPNTQKMVYVSAQDAEPYGEYKPGAVTDKLGFYLDYRKLGNPSLHGQGEEHFDAITEGAGGGWEQMSEDQISDYYYLYNTQGQAAAYQYLSDVEEVLRRDRYLAERAATIEEFKNASGLEKLWMSIKSVPAQWAANVTTNIERARQKVTGDEWKPYTGIQYASNVRQLQAEALDKK
jgi:hypothetical protein